MNSRSVIFLAAGLVAASTVHAASEAAPITAYAASQPGPVCPAGSVECGSSRDFVVFMIGPPAARLSPDIWVYWNYRSTDQSPDNRGFDTLVVTFAHDRVSGMKLVNEEPIRRCLALLERRAAQRYAADKP